VSLITISDYDPGDMSELLGNKRPRVTVTPIKQKFVCSNESCFPTTEFKTKSLTSGPHVARHTNDDVHSSISPCPVMWAFIDTPVFQRLRGLRQLGVASYVYMNANHTRFEHSLGVAHLAEKLMENIWKRQPQLRSPTADKDLLCVKLAALFHDLGHGPFSHIYEDFVKVALPQYLANQPQSDIREKNYTDDFPKRVGNWKHEYCSLDMIDLCLKQRGLAIDACIENIDKPLRQIGDGIDARSMRLFTDKEVSDEMILTSRDFIFIKECIWGGPLPGCVHLVGRPDRKQEWLYNIVANNHSGLDVDKIDYFARDGRHCLREAGEIEMKFIKEAFVAWGQCTNESLSCPCRKFRDHRSQHLMICYPEKMIPQSLAFFKKRFDLHKKIYQHKTVVSSGLLICDIFCKADPFFRIFPTEIQEYEDRKEAAIARLPLDDQSQHKSQPLPLSLAMLNPLTYVGLRDSIVDIIGVSREPELQGARDLVKRLNARECYKRAAYMPLNIQNSIHCQIWDKNESEIQREMLCYNGMHGSDDQQQLTLNENDFIVVKGEIHYGQKDKNPILQMRFLSKDKMSLLIHDVDELPEAKAPSAQTYQAEAPAFFTEKSIKVFSRVDLKTDLIQHVFQLWWVEANQEIEQTSSHVMEGGEACFVTLTQESFDDDDENWDS
jgi:deoxynucleoside triphosphate triphosphohydrolase SAMHD1